MPNPGTTPPPPDEFYIGWSARAPAGIARFTGRAVAVLLLLGVVSALVLALSQRTIGVARFEYGTKRTFEGVFWKSPHPHLVVRRPGQAVEGSVSRYFLVRPWKFGLPREVAEHWNGRHVAFEGTLIYRPGQTMIELDPGTLRDVSSATPLPAPGRSLGVHTLRGEIVDSKCYFGVMNPGNLKPHRACAVRCISGGVPPVLLVRDARGDAMYFLLVGADGRTINKDLLSMVAEPVEITGEVVRYDNLLALRAEPSSYRALQ
jgi:hypothetical protein